MVWEFVTDKCLLPSSAQGKDCADLWWLAPSRNGNPIHEAGGRVNRLCLIPQCYMLRNFVWWGVVSLSTGQISHLVEVMLCFENFSPNWWLLCPAARFAFQQTLTEAGMKMSEATYLALGPSARVNLSVNAPECKVRQLQAWKFELAKRLCQTKIGFPNLHAFPSMPAGNYGRWWPGSAIHRQLMLLAAGVRLQMSLLKAFWSCPRSSAAVPVQKQIWQHTHLWLSADSLLTLQGFAQEALRYLSNLAKS